jgi:DNA-binding NarL/FixJ family response regulator
MKTSATPSIPSALNSNQNGSESERSIHSIHGAKGGRPRLPVDIAKAQEFLAHGYSVKSIARQMNVGEGTLRRALGLVDVQRQGELSPEPRQKPLEDTL